MKIRIIEGRCTGHARCAAAAPEVYHLNSDGYLELAPTVVSPELEAAARRGARACPERAIEVTADDAQASKG
jgi:ferredoxin